MKLLLQKIQSNISRWLGSPKFFYVLLGLLVLQSLWIALAARYPQAFDENYHFGLIQLHAQQWLPWFTTQLPGADIYGAIARDPSYFYHYLFSWPYRLISALTDSLAAQVIFLRLLNIGIFVAGLYAYRTLFDELGISRRLRHVVLLFFVLTPIVPLLVGQINYDNLLFLLTGLLFTYLVRFWRYAKNHDAIAVDLTLKILFLGAFGCIVKYPFAPIFAGIVGVMLVGAVLVLRRRKPSAEHQIFAVLKRSTVVTYAVLLLVVGILFAERYGINMLRYHTPVPDCAAVISVEQCRSYSPWGRDYLFARENPKPTTGEMLGYPVVWARQMVRETTFTITSRFAPNGTVDYFGAPSMPLLHQTTWVVTIVGTLLCAVFVKRLWRFEHLRILLIIIAMYVLALFVKNVAMYLHAGQAVAIHGRYLVPVFPVIYLMIALGFGWGLQQIRWLEPLSNLRAAKVWLMILTMIFFLHGAGLLTWLMRSQSDWYWPQSQPAEQINWTAKNALKPLIVE